MVTTFDSKILERKDSMRKIHKVLTPENVCLEFELAGLGSRMIAFTIDSIIQLSAIMVIGIVIILGGYTMPKLSELNSYIVAISIVAIFVIYFGYFIAFEMIMNGQSPGKKIVGLKVIRQTGESVTIFDSILRNLFRLADFLPSFYLVGALTIALNDKYKRVGDMASNTVVVKLKKHAGINSVESLVSNPSLLKNEDTFNVYRVSENEYKVLKEYMERKGELGERTYVFTYHLNKYFSERFDKRMKYNSPYDFFEDILRINKDR